MQHFRANHFAAFHFATNHLRGLAQAVSGLVGGGKGTGAKKKRIIVVEFEGREYRVNEDNLQSFLANLENRVEAQPVSKKVKRRRNKVSEVVEESKELVVIKSAPIDILDNVRQQVSDANNIIANMIYQAAINYWAEIDEEDELILLMV